MVQPLPWSPKCQQSCPPLDLNHGLPLTLQQQFQFQNPNFKPSYSQAFITCCHSISYTLEHFSDLNKTLKIIPHHSFSSSTQIQHLEAQNKKIELTNARVIWGLYPGSIITWFGNLQQIILSLWASASLSFTIESNAQFKGLLWENQVYNKM